MGTVDIVCCFPVKAKVRSMHGERTTYRIHDLNTGQMVALMDADGTLHEEGDPQAIAQLKELLQRELLVRDRQLGYTMPRTKTRGMSPSLKRACATLA